MSSRVIIPEIIGEGGESRSSYDRGTRPDPPRFQPPAVGMGATLRALGAGVVLVVAVSAILLLGFTFLLLAGAVFSVLWLASLLRGKSSGPSQTVVFRTTRTDRSGNSVVVLERLESRSSSQPDGARPE